MVVVDRIDTKALLARVDIVDVVGGYVPLTKSGAEYEACCPFHVEKTPSFKVSPAKQIYHCFGCGASGDAIRFVQEFSSLSFVDACRELGGGESVAAGAAPVRKVIERERKVSVWSPAGAAPADAPEPPAAHYKRGLPEMTWCYRDAAGAVLGFVYRFKTSDGGKETLPIVWARNTETGAVEWHWMTWQEPVRPLYGLDRLAARPAAAVLVVEGEKCADAAQAELPDVVVVCWPGGGKAVDKIDFSPLAGRSVILWPDCDAKRERLTPDERAAGIDPMSKPLLPEADQPGVQAMTRVAEKLLALGCRVREVAIPAPGEKADGWDVADAVAEGLRGAALAAYIRSNFRAPRVSVPVVADVPPDAEPPSYVCEEVPLAALGVSAGGYMAPRSGVGARPTVASGKPLLVDAAEWLDQSAPIEWVVDGVIQRGQLYAMTAITNHGKTAISLYLAMCVAGRKKFCGREISSGAVLVLCGENPDGFRTRLRATMAALDLDSDDLRGQVIVLPVALQLREYVEQIVEECQALGPFALVLIDTSVSYFTGDNEDDNLQARSHAWDMRELIRLPGHPAVIANCHPTKSADRDNLLPRGGGAFLNEIDTNLTVWADGESALLHWQRKKRGPDFDPLPCEFHGKTLEERGQKLPTVVALPITEERAKELKRARNEDENRLLYAMLHHPDGSYAEWADACGWNGEKAKSKVFRVMERLKEDKLVEKTRKGMALTAKGREEAKSIR